MQHKYAMNAFNKTKYNNIIAHMSDELNVLYRKSYQLLNAQFSLAINYWQYILFMLHDTATLEVAQ